MKSRKNVINSSAKLDNTLKVNGFDNRYNGGSGGFTDIKESPIIRGEHMKTEESGELAEVRCSNCDKTVYIFENHIKEKMFCTISCMDEYDKRYLQEERNKKYLREE